MIILTDKQIRQKVRRLAYEIIEQNTEEKVIWLAGINNNGYAFAKILANELRQIKDLTTEIRLCNIRINPASPTTTDITTDIDPKTMRHHTVIIVDDVSNTGRTIFYAFKPFLNYLMKKVQIAVLVQRMHKQFPVHVDFIGLSLATTIHENIEVVLASHEKWEARIT